MGVGGLRIAEYPEAVGVHHEDEVRKNVEQVLFDRIIEGLTTHHVRRHTSTSVPVQNPAAIVFRGTSDQVQEFFRRQQWTDGCRSFRPLPSGLRRF
jgi:hypothetical protein